MTKSDATGAQSLEEILAQIKKSVAGEAGPARTGTAGAASAGGEASSRPADGGLSARLAGVLKDTSSARPGDDDYTELLAAGEKAQGPAEADPAKLTEARRRAVDPLWFLRQPSGTAPQDGTPPPTPSETGAVLSGGEIRLSRPQDLRASLPPLFGAEDQQQPLARMPETQPNPPQTAATGKLADPAVDNIHTAKTQPLMPPAPDMADESPGGAGTPEPRPASDIQAAAPAAVTSGEPSQPASGTIEVKPDDSFQPQIQAASTAMPAPHAEPASVKSTSPGAGLQARTLEQVIGELLEPVIRQWLEANLPRLVEELVRTEVARAIAVERPRSAQ